MNCSWGANGAGPGMARPRLSNGVLCVTTKSTLRLDNPARKSPADPLNAARDRPRRLDLDHEVDGPHVDAELERRGCHQSPDEPRFQPVFDLDALRPGEGAVVRADQRFARQLVERRGQPLREAPAVDEDQGGLVRLDQLEQPRVNRAPDRLARR